jgi:hypothetical protein
VVALAEELLRMINHISQALSLSRSLSLSLSLYIQLAVLSVCLSVLLSIYLHYCCIIAVAVVYFVIIVPPLADPTTHHLISVQINSLLSSKCIDLEKYVRVAQWQRVLRVVRCATNSLLDTISNRSVHATTRLYVLCRL